MSINQLDRQTSKKSHTTKCIRNFRVTNDVKQGGAGETKDMSIVIVKWLGARAAR